LFYIVEQKYPDFLPSELEQHIGKGQSPPAEKTEEEAPAISISIEIP
jgi:hypothetical protein